MTGRAAGAGRLAGAAALVTGGGGGIGRAVVDAFVAEGARVTVLERAPEQAAALQAAHGGAVDLVAGDAADAGDLGRAVERAVGHGGGRLDTLVAGVGMFDGHVSVRDLDLRQLGGAFDELYRVNVRATLLAVRAAWPHLAASRGSVILTLSGSAFYPEGGGVLYGSSKWALRGMVAHLARDLAPEVRVNGVAPGGTGDTHLPGLGTLGQTAAGQAPGRDERIRAGNLLGVLPLPADHAGAYVYLAAPDARVVTGAVINSDGGRG